jgi:hypothetical protein
MRLEIASPNKKPIQYLLIYIHLAVQNRWMGGKKRTVPLYPAPCLVLPIVTCHNFPNTFFDEQMNTTGNIYTFRTQKLKMPLPHDSIVWSFKQKKEHDTILQQR